MAEFVQVGPDDPRALEALDRYFAELNRRFRSGFDPGSSSTISDREMMTWPMGVFLVLVEDERVVGCGGVHVFDDVSAEVKRMWIDDGMRGQGLGKLMLARLEDEARRLGKSRVVLDTNDTLKEAISMYERSGYQSIERYNDNPYAEHFFEKLLD